jgi:tRNA1(Val) A37 N6-methylase TrmN6
MTFTLLGGKLAMNGPAPAEDALWLAASVEIEPGMTILDAAAGSGVAGLALLARCPGLVVAGVEIQPALTTQAEANAALNKLTNYSCVAQDILHFRPSQKFDAVICNPPFYPAERGHQSESDARRIARHQPPGMLEAWLRHLVTLTNGPVYMVLHSASQAGLRTLAQELELTVDILPLATHASRLPKRFLARLIAGGFDWRESVPLKSYDAPLRATVLEEAEPVIGYWPPYRGR